MYMTLRVSKLGFSNMNLFSLKENENIKPLNVVSYAKLSNLELILNLFPLQLRYALPEGKKKKDTETSR